MKSVLGWYLIRTFTCVCTYKYSFKSQVQFCDTGEFMWLVSLNRDIIYSNYKKNILFGLYIEKRDVARERERDACVDNYR